MKKIKKGRGGARAGAGRKPTGQKTKITSFRFPANTLDEARKLYPKELNSLANVWLKDLVIIKNPSFFE